MEHEALLIGSLQAVDELLVFAGAERGDDQSLRLAAREQGRAMGARQDADLRQNGTHRRQIAPVDAALVVENVPAHDLGLGVVEGFADLLLGEFRLAALGQERREHLRLDGVDGGVALLLLGDRIGGAQIGFADFQHRLFDRRFVDRRELARLLGGAFGQTDDRVDHRLEGLVAGHDGAEHDLFGKLFGLRFDHQHRFAGAGDDEVEFGILQFVDGRIDLDFALDIADARRADRPHERDARQRQSGGRGDQRENVGIGLEVMAEHGDDDLRLAAEPVREQRTDRAIDQAGGQRLLVGKAPFALQKAAGDAPRRKGLFLIMDGQGEKIDARVWPLWRRPPSPAPSSRPSSRTPRHRPGGRCGRSPIRGRGRTN